MALNATQGGLAPLESAYERLMARGLSAACIGDGSDSDYRIEKYFEWLAEREQGWWQADLAAYRDELKARGLSPATIRAYLSSVRSGLRRITLDRDLLYTFAPTDAPPERRKAIVDEIDTRLRIAADPEKSRVKMPTMQDRDSRDELRLTRAQAEKLLKLPDPDSLKGLRDMAIIGLMLCTGIREGELVQVEVSDLHARLGDELALRVRLGKGSKQRLIPYGDLNWILVIIGRWLREAGITEGPVFRGVYKGGKSVRDTPLTTRAVRMIMKRYAVTIEGERRTVRPHDLRRTYARRMFEAGADMLAIQQNLGHRKQETTQAYIGDLDADRRRAPSLYDADLDDLVSF